MTVHEIKHPLVQHKLGLMRANGISTKNFRELCGEVGALLTYEATRNLQTEKVTIEGWQGNNIEVENLTIVIILNSNTCLLFNI